MVMGRHDGAVRPTIHDANFNLSARPVLLHARENESSAEKAVEDASVETLGLGTPR